MNKKTHSDKLPPVWLVKSINAFRETLLFLNKKMFPGNVVLYEQFQHFWMLPSLYVAAELNIAEILKKHPKTVDEIARVAMVDSPSLYRIMRALSSQGIFKELKNKVFANNRMSNALLDQPGSLRNMLVHHLGPVNWNAMSYLLHALKCGGNAFEHAHGLKTYDYLKSHPDEHEVFDKSMSSLSDLGLSPILNACDLSGISTIADIGGGEGFFLANLLVKHQHLKGILFDTPEALLKAPAISEKFGVTHRVTTCPGDFFTSVPVEADCYILKNIIHNWDDPHCISILHNIRSRMSATSRILIMDMIVAPNNKPSLAKLLDIQMLVTMQGGKERTKPEFESIITQSGLKLKAIHPTIAPLSIIEAIA